MTALPVLAPEEAASSTAGAAAELAATTPTSGVTLVDATNVAQLAKTMHRDELAEKLRERRLEMLPVSGPGAPTTRSQGRTHSEGTSVSDGLEGLISSISSMGVIQPILVEETRDAEGAVHRVVVSGERRLRAVRVGATDDPDNPHFRAIPAMVVPGPLSDPDRRGWQLVENLARDDLSPGELGAQLMFTRCALLITNITAARVAAVRAGDTELVKQLTIPASVETLDDPVARFEELEKIRGKITSIAAPWETVLKELGMRMNERKARQIVAAFRALPRHLSEEMDAEKVALHTRATFIELRKGRTESADEIWAALKGKRAPKLLHAASQIALADPELSAPEVVQRAEEADANARAERSQRPHAGDSGASTDASQGGEAGPANRPDSEDPHGEPGESTGNTTAAPGHDEATVTEKTVETAVVSAALTSARELLAALSDGATLNKYDAGSVKLVTRQILEKLSG